MFLYYYVSFFFFFQAEDGIRDTSVTGVQTCALPIFFQGAERPARRRRPRAATAALEHAHPGLYLRRQGTLRAFHAVEEIGRASCSERVEITVVEVSVEKKHRYRCKYIDRREITHQDK